MTTEYALGYKVVPVNVLIFTTISVILLRLYLNLPFYWPPLSGIGAEELVCSYHSEHLFSKQSSWLVSWMLLLLFLYNTLFYIIYTIHHFLFSVLISFNPFLTFGLFFKYKGYCPLLVLVIIDDQMLLALHHRMMSLSTLHHILVFSTKCYVTCT